MMARFVSDGLPRAKILTVCATSGLLLLACVISSGIVAMTGTRRKMVVIIRGATKQKQRTRLNGRKRHFANRNMRTNSAISLTDCGWADKERQDFEAALNHAVEKYKTQGIDAVLAEHFSQPKNNLRFPARRHNFPREMVWAHLTDIVQKHPQFVGGMERVKEALNQLHEIINDHRKEPRRIGTPQSQSLPTGGNFIQRVCPKCDSSKNRHIRRFKLLEFLATRSFVRKDGARDLASRKCSVGYWTICLKRTFKRWTQMGKSSALK